VNAICEVEALRVALLYMALTPTTDKARVIKPVIKKVATRAGTCLFINYLEFEKLHSLGLAQNIM
jgi:hypothetical protein